MLKKIAENARYIMYLSIALFFFSLSGFIITLYWSQNPITTMTNKLLDHDGKLLIKIFSDQRTLNAIKELTKSNGKKTKSADIYLIDRLLQNDAQLLKSLTSSVLNEKFIANSIKKLLSTNPNSKSVDIYLADKLLQNDAHLLKSLTSSVLQQKIVRNTIQQLLHRKDKHHKSDFFTRYLLDKLLQKDARILKSFTASILQQKIVRDTLQQLLQQKSNAKSTNTTRYLIDQFLRNDARLLKSLTSSILNEKIVRNTLQQILQQKKSPTSRPVSTQQQNEWNKLTQLLLEKLLANQGQLLINISSRLLPIILKSMKTPLTPAEQRALTIAEQKNKEKLLQFVQKLSQKIVDRFLANDAQLLRKIAGELLLKLQKNTSSSTSSKNTIDPTIQQLGKYAIDKLLRARAKNLRAILQEIVGAEISRILRETRFMLTQLKTKLNNVQLERLVQTAAYSTGKGALEEFLRNQEMKKQRERRKKLILKRQLPHFQKAMTKRFKCLIPAQKTWIEWKNNTLQMKIAIKRTSPCDTRSCGKLKGQFLLWLQHQKILTFDPKDLQLTFYPDCIAEISPPKREKNYLKTNWIPFIPTKK